MALRTPQQYYDSLKSMKPTAYILGEKVAMPSDHPLIKVHCAAVAQTYALALDPQGRELLVDKSNLIGEEVNRFVKLFESPVDLMTKVRMLRYLTQRTGTCYMRCTGMDALNAAAVVTREVDRKHGTGYHKRFLDYLSYVQKNDLTVWSGVTDVKGDRSLRPSAQPDPDMYVHVVDKRKDGIIVRGAKIHQSGSLCANEGLIMPSREMTERDRDYAACFAIQGDARGGNPRLRQGDT